MTNLIKYDSARFALQQAVEIDEVKDIRDKAEAMAAYARQANDTQLVEWATEIKVRAERKAGLMLSEMDMNRGSMGSGSNQHEVRSHDVTAPKLIDLGITKNQSSRWQKLAAVPEDQFEQAIVAAKEVAGEVTTAAMLRIEKANRQPSASRLSEKCSPTTEHSEKESTHEPEFDEKEHLIAELKDTVVSLDEENTRLKDAIATSQLPEEEIQSAAEIIDGLRKQVKALEAELDATRSTRDALMVKNAQLEKQCLINSNKLKKAGIQ